MRKSVAGIIAVLVVAGALAAIAEAAQPKPTATGKGMAAIEQAAGKGKYLFLFLFFFKDKSVATAIRREDFEKATKNLRRRADSVMIDITDPSEKPIVDKFNLSRAAMPLVLSLAPNGAVTGAFIGSVNQKQLEGAFATPCMEKCLKELQQGKLVFLCIRNKKTRANDAAMRGVNDFKADARYAKVTEIVTLDPADKSEAKFLSQLKVDPTTRQAMTVFLAPPAVVVTTVTGETEKDKLVAALAKARTSGCGPGSKPGCCARPK